MATPLRSLYDIITDNPVVVTVITLIVIAILVKMLHWIRKKW